MTPEVIQKLVILRQKMVDGTATKEELIEAVKLMREDRMTATAATSTTRKKAVKAAIPSASSLLDELGKV